MEKDILESGWQKLTSDTNNDYLYRLIKTQDLSAGVKLVNQAVALASSAKLDVSSHFSVNGSVVTISLNSPATKALASKHFSLARQINELLP